MFDSGQEKHCSSVWEYEDTIARLEKRLDLLQEDQLRQERISDNHRNLLAKVNLEYEALLEKNRRMAEELHYKNMHLSGILENAPYPLFTLDREMRLKTANSRTHELFNSCVDSPEGRSLDELVPDELAAGIVGFAWHCLRNARPVIFETVLHKEGGEQLLELTLFPIPMASEDAADVCCIVRDQTIAREKLADQVLQGQVLESRVLKASLAHEINNPLNGIINYAELALDMENDEPSRAWFEEILKLAERATNIVTVMLDSSGGGNIPEDSPFALSKAIDDALLLLRQEMKRRQIELTLEMPHDEEPFYGLYVELVQIIQNIVLNAVQALDAQPPCEERAMVRVACEQDRDRKEARISIEDNGPGIRDEDLTRIFHPFFTTKDMDTGSGLGLYICRKLAKRLGGEIDVESSHKGTRFVLTMPWRSLQSRREPIQDILV